MIGSVVNSFCFLFLPNEEHERIANKINKSSLRQQQQQHDDDTDKNKVCFFSFSLKSENES